MKSNFTKPFKIVRIIFAIILIVLFIDLAIGEFMNGWLSSN